MSKDVSLVKGMPQSRLGAKMEKVFLAEEERRLRDEARLRGVAIDHDEHDDGAVAVGGAGAGVLSGRAAAASAEPVSSSPAVAAADAERATTPEASLPEQLLLHVLDFLSAEEATRCAIVSLRWRRAAQAEVLWKRICRRTIAAFHPADGPLGTGCRRAAAMGPIAAAPGARGGRGAVAASSAATAGPARRPGDRPQPKRPGGGLVQASSATSSSALASASASVSAAPASSSASASLAAAALPVSSPAPLLLRSSSGSGSGSGSAYSPASRATSSSISAASPVAGLAAAAAALEASASAAASSAASPRALRIPGSAGADAISARELDAAAAATDGVDGVRVADGDEEDDGYRYDGDGDGDDDEAAGDGDGDSSTLKGSPAAGGAGRSSGSPRRRAGTPSADTAASSGAVVSAAAPASSAPISSSAPAAPRSAAAAAGTTEPELSLSVSRQRQIDAAAAAAAYEASQRDAYKQARSAMLTRFLAEATGSKSYRKAFFTIPAVRFSGVYALRHQYVRRGINDLFHAHPGVLLVTYHRVFLFFPDGRVHYAMAPGLLSASIKSLRRLAALTSGAVDAGSGSGAGAGAGASAGSSDDGGGAGGGSTGSIIARGRYELHGDLVRLTVTNVASTVNITTHWSFSLGTGPSPGSYNDMLTVVEATLCEYGAPRESGSAISALEGQEFTYQPLAGGV